MVDCVSWLGEVVIILWIERKLTKIVKLVFVLGTLEWFIQPTFLPYLGCLFSIFCKDDYFFFVSRDTELDKLKGLGRILGKNHYRFQNLDMLSILLKYQ